MQVVKALMFFGIRLWRTLAMKHLLAAAAPGLQRNLMSPKSSASTEIFAFDVAGWTLAKQLLVVYHTGTHFGARLR